MIETRSPSEYYIKYLISKQDELDPEEVQVLCERIYLDPIDLSYIRDVARFMEDCPSTFDGVDPRHSETRGWLKAEKIYDMWFPTPSVREALLILSDVFLREKLEPLLLSSVRHDVVAKKLRRHTSIALTTGGVRTYGHYFWNRRLLTQTQWLEYLSRHTYAHQMRASLTSPVDQAVQHVPWVVNIQGPPNNFSLAEAARRMGQIALKFSLELEQRPSSIETTASLKNCIIVLDKADQISRRSDVGLQEVLKQFQKFRMRTNKKHVINVEELTDGNFGRPGERRDDEDGGDF